VELASLCLLLAPVGELQLVIAGVIQLVSVVVLDVLLLQGEEDCCCHLLYLTCLDSKHSKTFTKTSSSKRCLTFGCALAAIWKMAASGQLAVSGQGAVSRWLHIQICS